MQKQTGLRAYLYEYMFFRSIEQTKKNTGAPIMVSQGRRLRDEVEARLAAQGYAMTDPRLPLPPVLSAIDGVLGDNVEGYKPLFGDHTSRSMGYRQLSEQFLDMVGEDQKLPDGSTKRANPGALGARLPISPYDPRFATRATVKRAGSQLLYVPEDTLDMVVDGDPSRVAGSRLAALKLFSANADGTKLTEAGQAYTVDDASGLSELMGYMSAQEYNNVRSWVVQGARVNGGRPSADRFMTPEALNRAVAILQELGEQGTPYTVTRDRYPGQIKAQITGTKIEVRLTDVRENEHYVGRVYDDGVEMYFTTTVKDKNTRKPVEYKPTAADCVSLLRVAQGRPVERTDGKGLVGEVATRTERRWDKASGRYAQVEVNDSYFSGATQSCVLGQLAGTDGHVMIRRDGRSRTAASRLFKTPEEGTEFLTQAVESARANLYSALAVDELAQAAADHAEEIEAGTYQPDFHGDPQVASVQRVYWSLLTGKRSHLLTVDGTEEDYNEVTAMVEQMGIEDPVLAEQTRESLLMGWVYTGDPLDQIHKHVEDVLDSMVGTMELKTVIDPETDEVRNLRFDPVGVSQYMTSEFGVWRNNDEIVAALRVSGIDPDELRGSSFYNTTIKDRMIRFDEATATDMLTHEDPFLAAMGGHVRDAIGRNACTPTSILVDGNGVVSWTAERRSAQLVDGAKSTETVTGEIGQVFAPGDHGEIVTKFAGGENYMFVPGYEADIVTQKAGENLSVEERTRLRGYEQIMASQIDYQISSDLLTTRTAVGAPTELNGVYRRLYDVRHEVDFIEKSREEGLTDEWRDAILETEGRRVRYGNDIKEGSTINAEYQAAVGRGYRDPSNDNNFDAWVLTGGRNMAILTREGDGYFDPIMTSGSTNQGITRYLVEGAQVTEDGRIVRGDLDDRTPLMKHPDAQYMSFSPFDRQQMTASNLMQAAAVTEPVGTAMMTLGGWTADDPMVVSQRFADNHMIRGADGQMRPLVVGDKLSDLHGNKGVISLIVDPQMDDAEARAQQLDKVVEVFRANEKLDVVMSPFSAVSRFNGGSARELMASPSDLMVPAREGDPFLTEKAVKSGMGEMRFIVTHMAVDSKTRIYDDEDLAVGRGRKASSQLAWALGAQGCDKVLAECYGTNTTAVSNLREMLITCGMDIEADGTLRMGYEEHNAEDQRRLIEMPELAYNDNGGLDTGRMKREFGALIGDKGGDLEIPFPLEFPTHEQVPVASSRENAEGEQEPTSWKVPLLSSHLRSGQDLGDGTSTVHDYTNHYLAIQEQAVRYRFAKERLADPSYTDPKGRANLEKTVKEAPGRAQMAFDSITDDIQRRRFSGKYNVFKEQLMAARMPNSATAVWTSDPRLDIDQVSMGTRMAESLGVGPDDHVLVWRDPMLRDAGVRYMRVAIDERLHGIAINPVMDKSFDGDFDGDSVAVVKLNTEAAKREAMEKLTVGANLLDLGSQDENGLHELMMQDSLDVKVTQHEYPGVKTMFEEFKIRANDAHFLGNAGEMTPEEVWAERQALVLELSDYYRDEALGRQVGGAVLQFGDVQQHLDSVVHSCVETGAKGSMAKVQSYAEYLGAQIDDAGVAHDLGRTMHTREDDEAVEYATAVKSFGTGVAGTFSQRGVKALRNEELKAVLELTYPVTQSILQSKHDPVEAKAKYEVLMGPARDLWKGRLLVEVRNSTNQRSWEAARDNKGKEIQADTETWKRQFEELYSAKDGLNVKVNPDYIEAVAEALSRGGQMIDIEEEQSLASPMDRMAYGGDFETLVELAKGRANVFEGEQNGHFAPFVVRQNARALAEYDRALEERGMTPAQRVLGSDVPEVLMSEQEREAVRREAERGALAADVAEPEITAISRKDTRAGSRGRLSNQRSDSARAVGGRESWKEGLNKYDQPSDHEQGDDFQP